MKTIFNFSLLALAAAALFSCQKPAELADPSTGDRVVRTFTCTFAQPDTKVAIADDGKTTWEAGDEILIHAGADGNKSAVVTLASSDISSDGKTATITIPEDLEPYDREDAGYLSKFYAIYPASAASTENAMFYETRINAFDVPTMGAYDDGEGHFVFMNLCGVISFSLPASAAVDNFTFAGNGNEVVAYYPDYQCRYALQLDGSVDYRYTYKNGANSTAYKLAQGNLIPGETTYLCLPEGVNFSNGFTFKFYNGEDLKWIATTENPVDIARGKILMLGDISSHLEEYVPPQTSDHKSSITGATDLSSLQANCYVISAAGAYKFPALKGNSDEEAGSVFGAEILWETYNNDTEVPENSVIAAVDFEDNWIYFQTPSTLKPGNAVIAAKDVNGKIIWSWHIWIPQTTVTDVDGFMSRNLGALVDATGSGEAAIESCGLFYQFGRKDPFPCSKSWDSSSPALTSKELAAKSDVQITLAQSIANPTVFAYKGDTAVDPTWDGANWCLVSEEYWYDAEGKTMYDPCPKGYKVPESIGGEWTSDYTQHWYSNGSLVFPHAGYMDDCGGKITNYGQRNKLWFSTGSSSSEKSAHCIYVKKDAVDAETSTHKACGANVRCVAE